MRLIKLNKKILVVSQYFYPEQFRINDICEEWAKKGYDVTVLTGIPNYPIGKYYEGYGLLKKRKEIYRDINIIRIPIFPRLNNSISLALNYFSFVLSGLLWSKFTSKKFDIVFVYEVSPMFQALPGVWYSKRKKIPLYLYVLDLWPENVEYITGIKSKIIIHPIGKVVDYIYKNSYMIFTTSKSFITSINNRGHKKNNIFFWPQYAEDFYRPVNNSSNTNKNILDKDAFNIIFTGNIGQAQGLEILIETANILKEINLKCIFNLVGDGRRKQYLINQVKNNNITEYFNFIPKQPAKEIPYIISLADATLITLADIDIFSNTIPAKTQSYLACGKPILVSANGEVQKVIIESKSGYVSESGDAEKLAKNIIKLMELDIEERKILGENATKYYKKYFNKNDLFIQMDQWLNKEGKQ